VAFNNNNNDSDTHKIDPILLFLGLEI